MHQSGCLKCRLSLKNLLAMDTQLYGFPADPGVPAIVGFHAVCWRSAVIGVSRNRVGIGLSYRPASAGIVKNLRGLGTE
jgi:hypothetical protein